MELKYSVEKGIQRLIAIMKHHGIKKIVISPGAQNVCFVASVQQDGFFELYSAPDERSAAYIACGMAAETGEAVALSCTGATASRNYIPALTEAYYRKLPVLAITSTPHQAYIGQNTPQMLDRSVVQKDIVKKSIYVPLIMSKDDDWGAVVSINSALLELKRAGGGPVHINLETSGSSDYSVSELPKTRFIDRIGKEDKFPSLSQNMRIAIFVGQHNLWDEDLVHAVETFCKKYNAVVLCDHTSNYTGEFKIMPALITFQTQYDSKCKNIDLLIDIGNISGAYIRLNPKEVWRVNPDGEVRDTFKSLRYVFEMSELSFFKYYAGMVDNEISNEFYDEWIKEYDDIYKTIPDIPFSNIWIAQQMIKSINYESCVHLGILNSLRSWNFFNTTENISFFSNTGGFGIDGPISTVLGGALSRPDLIHFMIVGDLAFFYDMNALGNRDFPSNIRILLVNNGVGTEFKNYSHKAAQFGEKADLYMAARGHYGNQSRLLVQHYAEDLGLIYLSASSKEEFSENINEFIKSDISKSMVLEVFTNSEEESTALKTIRTLKTSVEGSTKQMVKQILGTGNVKKIKNILNK